MDKKLFGWTSTLALSLLSIASAWSGNPQNPEFEIRTNDQGAREVWMKPPSDNPTQNPLKMGTIVTLPPGKTYYHWDTAENTERWGRNGWVDAGEVAYLDKGQGAVGGGFYLSSDILDSSTYGNKLIVFRTTQPITLLSFDTGSDATTWIKDWNTFNQKLLANGVDGITNYDTPTWSNVFDANPLTRAHVATWKDVEESDHFKSKSTSVVDFLLMNKKIPVQDTPWLRDRHPELGQWLRGEPPTFANPLFRDQILDWLKTQSDPKDQTPLTQAIRKYFKPEILMQLKSDWSQAEANPGPFAKGEILQVNIPLSRKAGIPLSDWIPNIQIPEPLFPGIIDSGDLMNSELNAPKESFAADLNKHLMRQELRDSLEAIATGKSVESLYDSPGEPSYRDRWYSAFSKWYDNDGLAAARALAGKTPVHFRSVPASSDGDIPYNGKKYFRVDPRQKSALAKNPFIRAEFAVIKDPADPARTIEIARYDYPTAADYKKFSPWILDEQLNKDLDAATAQGWLTKPDHPKTRALTARMMKEVIAQTKDVYFVDRHMLLTSLHPFSQLNTETIANLFTSVVFDKKVLFSGMRTIPGKPDHALLYSVEDFHALLYSHLDSWDAWIGALNRESDLHSNFPKYFDLPELWQIGRKVPVAKIGSDSAQFVAQSKIWFSRPPSCMATQLSQSLGSLSTGQSR